MEDAKEAEKLPNGIKTLDADALQQIWSWNASVPAAVDRCVHDLFAEVAQSHPEWPAVCAWDGDLTYGELDDLSTSLAHHLIDNGVGSDTLIPLCFEKSKWVPVAVLGVMKAGAGSVAFDTTQPEARLQTILEQVGASVILSSTTNKELVSRISHGCRILSVPDVLLSANEQDLCRHLPHVKPSSTLYVVFTSGSTGTPKGVIIAHSNFSSAVRYQQKALGFTSSSRVYDFVSYAFDVSWSNLLHTVTAGACLCIPSQSQRQNNVAESIRNLRANYADLTPSIFRLLEPALVKDLEHISFSGEVVLAEDAVRWKGAKKVINTYGPAECTVKSTVAILDCKGNSVPDIGHPVGVVTWLVDPDTNQLSGVGSVGEIWLEGPVVGQGYLKDPKKTRASFTEDPDWLLRGTSENPGRRGRLYKTGDLAKYNTDGSLAFIGRKDNQVKIRGQRVELGEVEHHVHECFCSKAKLNGDVTGTDLLLIAEVMTPKNSQSPRLVVFFSSSSQHIANSSENVEKSKVYQILRGLEEHLKERLPNFMIPDAYVAIDQVPMTATGKTDRKELRKLGESMTLEQLFPGNQSESKAPKTDMERRLQLLWSEVLRVDPNTISTNDSFLQIGGDSIAAMKVVAAVHEQGLTISVSDIFNQPQLCKQALLLTKYTAAEEISPFALLRPTMDKQSAKEKAALLCGLNSAQVEDIFPCTPIQEGLLALTSKRSGDYMSRNVLTLSKSVDLGRFRAAVERVALETPILRTRIIDLHGQGLVQVVVKVPVYWLPGGDLQTVVKHDQVESMGLGTGLVRFGIADDGPNSGDDIKKFVWTLHHALYDGWSLPILFEQIVKAYQEEELRPLAPFRLFVKYVSELQQEAAIAYWDSQLETCEAELFPALPSPKYQPKANQIVAHKVRQLTWPRSDITASTVLRAAWAILAARYTDAPDVLFGATVSGRQAPVAAVERIAGPTIATVPVRIRTNRKLELSKFLQQVQNQATEMTAFEQVGMQNIRLTADDASAVQFQTLLVVQPIREVVYTSAAVFDVSDEELQNMGSMGQLHTYALALTCEIGEDSVRLEASFDSAVMQKPQINRMIKQLGHAIRQICNQSNAHVKLGDLELISSADLHDLWTWNSAIPAAVIDRPVHEMISGIAKRQPSAPALNAWDGELSHSELDTLSTRLADQLIVLGVGRGVIVPLCFEKSMWTPVAMLGVMKAGGASVVLDVTQPKQRLQVIVNAVSDHLILSSSAQKELANELSSNVLVVDKDGVNTESQVLTNSLPLVTANDLLYIVFTSGSTGTPKGVMITHKNFSTALENQTHKLGFTAQSRVLDYASYAFDAAWYNLLHTLYAGGCLCIPSQSDRQNDISGSIVSLGATFANLAPKVAELLDEAAISALHVVELSGEAANWGQISRLMASSRVRFAYGPAECTVMSTVSQENPDTINIGRGVGIGTWVTDPHSASKLAMIGCVGELWIEGPLVGQGYLHDSDRTDASFVVDAPWLLRGGPQHPGRHGRLYKTGDLVRYQPDGSLIFVGRRDMQVKIRGQRVELGDIEHHVRKFLARKNDTSTVAEVIIPRDSKNPILALFFTVDLSGTLNNDKKRSMLRSVLSGIEEHLKSQLPVYMVPTAYIHIEEIPMTATGKVDRQKLRKYGSTFTLDQIAALNPTRRERRAPETHMESQLQSLWARVLDVRPESIGIDDSFLQIGGDSIAAMRLVAAARDHGLAMSVADIFNQPRLKHLASRIIPIPIHLEKEEEASPFKLLNSFSKEQNAQHVAATLCHVNSSDVEDIFPCTPLQEGLLALSIKREGDYINQAVFTLKDEIDLVRLRSSVEAVIDSNAILRTRIIDLPYQGLVQVVVKKGPTRWLTGASVDDLIKLDELEPMGLGSELNHLGIVDGSHSGGKRYLFWSLHHAVYDGWSFPLLLDQIGKLYAGNSIEDLTPFPPFVKYVMDLGLKKESVMEYWASQFEDFDAPTFPALPSSSYQPQANQTTKREIRGIHWLESDITASTAVRTSWAILSARYTNASDVIFGAIVSGRNAPVRAVDRLAGPTIATVPVRVRIDWNQSVNDLLQQIQDQATEMTAYEQTGLQRIGHEISVATQFQTLLVIQPAQQAQLEQAAIELFEDDHDATGNGDSLGLFHTYALALVCELGVNGLFLYANYDTNVLATDQVAKLLEQLEYLIRQLCDTKSQDLQVANLQQLSPQDLRDVWSWNSMLPPLIDCCIHDVIDEATWKHPGAMAIHAWDGKLTYSELAELSTRVAHQLTGIDAGTVVPICFEKSMWAVVAMLGVLKAGGAFVSLDPDSPASRRQYILDQIGTKAILTSKHNAGLFDASVYNAIIVDRQALNGWPDGKGSSTALSNDAAYVIFTSGSTGYPKGVLVEHQAATTSCTAHAERFGICETSRVLQFSSYTFDACITEIITALMHGACVCVPSDSSRLSDLTSVFNDLQINWALLTPTVARLLDPSKLPTLQTLALGAEGVYERDLNQWKGSVHLLNAYGPTECVVCCAINDYSSVEADAGTIGRPVGSVAWVVNPTDHNQLVPLGAVGELLVEGPILARGYFKDPEKTKAAFIESPPWLQRGGPSQAGRRSRLYKTGDLVKFHPDGSLTFVGRKDMQVKIHGQRVELHEVEHHIKATLMGKADVSVVAKMIMPRNSDREALVAFIVPDGGVKMGEKQLTATVAELTNGLSDQLSAVLPSFMIPISYLPLAKIPLMATGKMDHRCLVEYGSSKFTKSLLEHDTFVDPANEAEATLRAVFAEVLNLPTSSISVKERFLRLGGDSISAMQVVSRCRQRGIIFTVTDLLKMQTIQQLSMNHQQTCIAPSDSISPLMSLEEPEKYYPLSPAQKMFFAAHPEGLDHFNQSFLLRVKQPVRKEDLQAAAASLVSRHSMLRARFHRTANNGWMQLIMPESPEKFASACHEVQTQKEMRTIAQARQGLLSIHNGPVFAIDAFNFSDGRQTVLLTAHHLVVDLVSWRVIWHDLQNLLQYIPLGPQPVSFLAWSQMHNERHQYGGNVSPIQSSERYDHLQFWSLAPEENTIEHQDSLEVKLLHETTKLLLGESNDAFQSEPLDIMIAAMLFAFQEVFSERQLPKLYIESHGRELTDEAGLDLSETVGWFTKLHPLQVHGEYRYGIVNLLRVVKDTRKKEPRHNLPLLDDHSNSPDHQNPVSAGEMEIVLNYAGVYQQLESADSLFGRFDSEIGNFDIPYASPKMQRFGLIEVNAVIEEGETTFTIYFSKNMKHQERLKEWASLFVSSLDFACQDLASHQRSHTLVDFPLLKISYSGLDAVFDEQIAELGVRPRDVEDIYPCTPLQEGIIISQRRGIATYRNRWIWEASCGDGINLHTLAQAWRNVAQRHSILSTVFIQHPETGAMLQLVLRNPKPRIDEIHTEMANPVQFLQSSPEPSFGLGEPQWAVALVLSHTGQVACRLDISHALCDAESMSVLLRNLGDAYDSVQLSPAPKFRTVVEHLEATPPIERMEYWLGFLRGAESCLFPTADNEAGIGAAHESIDIVSPGILSRIYDFCRGKGITRSAFLHVAWALTLSQFTSMNQVCFGYLSSGRNSEINDVDHIVGPMISMLIGYVDLEKDINEVLQVTHQNSVNHIAHQHTSLAEIFHELNLRNKPLFNTTISVRQSPNDSVDRRPKESERLKLEDRSGVDPHEYDLSLSVVQDGKSTKLSLTFKTPSITTYTAREVGASLESAIAYILQSCQRFSTDDKHLTSRDNLRSAFFRWRMDIDEDVASKFWKQQFDGATPEVFPSPRPKARKPAACQIFEHSVHNTDGCFSSNSLPAMVWASWAICQAQSLSLLEAVFGVLVKDISTANQDSLQSARTPTAFLPVRIAIDPATTVGQLLRDVQTRSIEVTRYARLGQAWVGQLNKDTRQACQYQTMVIVRHESEQQIEVTASVAMTLQCILSKDELLLRVDFDETAIAMRSVKNLAHRLEHVMRQLCDQGNNLASISSLDVLSQQDLQDIWSWNATVPGTIPRCVHDLVTEQAQCQPNAIAIHSWDGDLAYKDVDELSTKLAHELIRKGVTPGDTIALCFEKSMWTTIAMLGVMKAGGASIALDVTQPEHRLSEIIVQARPAIILCTQENSRLAISLVPYKEHLIVNRASLHSMTASRQKLPCVDPQSTLYLAFTSGSTGQPKGVIITHSNLSSAITHQNKALGFESSSRVYDFASYAFDVAWYNAFQTLAAGGCLCVPSEDQRRNELSSSIMDLRANSVTLTPTVFDVLEDSVLKTLRVVETGGEAVTQAQIDRISKYTKARIAYGPVECTIGVTWASESLGDCDIGRGLGACTWVVNPDMPERLVPIGCVGELWIEGPLVGGGYLDDADKTNASFVHDPPWLLHGNHRSGHAGRPGRLYKTGDLVRYKPDGSLVFVGRKDIQVKVRGQRVELGEVEHHVRECLLEETQNTGKPSIYVVAELARPLGSEAMILVAFLSIPPDAATSDEERQSLLKQSMGGLVEKLSRRLPLYMVPAAYIPLNRIPTTTSGKTNRKELRRLVEGMGVKQLAGLDPSSNIKRVPTTKVQRQLQQLWVDVLKLETCEDIGIDDSFLQIGGDSISSMRLVAAARQQGLCMTVADVFNHPKLWQLAEVVRQVRSKESQEIRPLSLLKLTTSMDELEVRRKAAVLCGIDTTEVEDIFPCTPLQEGLLALTEKRPGDYVRQLRLVLRHDVRIDRLCKALEQLAASTPILRTRIIDLPEQGLVQVVVSKPIEWFTGSTTQEVCEQASGMLMGLGSPLTGFGLVEGSESLEGRHRLLWTLHHALYDGWSLPLLLNQVEKLYNEEQASELAPFQPFVRYIMDLETEQIQEYWNGQFQGCEATIFPALPSSEYQPHATQSVDHEVQTMGWPQSDITAATVIRAAWALLAARYTGSSDVTFGATVSGRQAPVVSIESMPGPTIATVPIRVKLNWQQSVDDHLRHLQRQAIEMTAFEQSGLQRVRHACPGITESIQFQTLLVIESGEQTEKGAGALFEFDEDNDNGAADRSAFNTYALALVCDLQPTGVTIKASFDAAVVSHNQAMRMVKQLAHTVRQLCDPACAALRICDLNMLTEEDWCDIWAWNAVSPPAVDHCLHDLFARTVQLQPNAPAICAWDGDLTYREVDELSTLLAHQLVRQGAKGTIVPLCFEKSMWTTIAMLGVMKAGGASVALDVTQPKDRLQAIAGQVNPVVTVSSRQSADLINSIDCCKHNIVVDSTSLCNREIPGEDALPQVDPNSTLYLAFTSGSTGEPKGVMITHSNLSSAITHQKSLGFTPRSRVYDFASYAFDVAWYNAFQTLVGGGCLCVPSEYQRKNQLSQSITELRANSATFTPTVLDVLDDSVLGSLETLETGGEAVSQAHIDRIQKFTNARIAYGPVECTIGVTWASGDLLRDRSIGRGLGACTWVVDPTSTDTLVGIGCIGELLIEGPLVGKGYLNDPAKTEAAFIKDPPWLRHAAPGHSGRRGRLYKTGDLVRYNPDGSLVFVSRKDTQVKIRGQRVELGGVEHHVHTCLINDSSDPQVSVTVEVITPADSERPLLLAFISPRGSMSMTQDVITNTVAILTSNINRQLAVTVPSYMIPSGYIPLSNVPKTTTGKTDRRAIQAKFSSMTLMELKRLLVTRSQGQPPSTPAEKLLQSLWSAVLSIEMEKIGADDSFFELGGDSILAMRLVGLARAQEQSLSVADIFLHRRLSNMAHLIQGLPSIAEEIQPFMLLKAEVDISAARSIAAAMCNTDEGQVEDIFPCTPLQEGLLAMTARRAGDYVANIERELAPGISVDKFKSSWDTLIEKTPILRTRIIDLPGQGLVQVVLKQEVPWLTYDGDSERDHVAAKPEIGLGTPLNHLVLQQDKVKGISIFKWSIHHALYDGWSMPLLLGALSEEYFDNQTTQLTTSQSFINHVIKSSGDVAETFWKQEYAGLQAERFPPLPFAGYQPRADTTIHRTIGHVDRPWGGYTISTVARSALSILIATNTASLDAVFGAVVNGRQAPVQGIERMAGPTIATVPVRVTVDRQRSLQQILEAVEDCSIRTTRFEQTGLQYIQRVSAETQEACRFQTLLVVQPASPGDDTETYEKLFSEGQIHSNNWDALDTFSTYAITVICQYDGSHLELVMTFDSNVLDCRTAERLMEQLDAIIHRICDPENAAARLDNLDMLSGQDLSDIWKWNAVVPPVVNECVHDLITLRAKEQPTATALYGWDGELTYQEVDELSSRLARHLIDINVDHGTIIPLCFEKSIWTSVAMLGVMKAGATAVALDVTQPEDRLRAIIHQVRPSVTVSSTQGAPLMNSICNVEHNIIVDQSALFKMTSTISLPVVSPNTPIYLAFTSGSTGEPKGIMISHSNLSSAIKHQQKILGFTPTSRVYDFASYAFDVAWYNAFQTLAAGGCLCVPSEHQRKNDLSSSILEFRANSVTLTPTVLDALDDSVLGTLRILETGGEAVSQAQIDRIQKYTKARIAYGPVECTIGVTWAWDDLGDRDIGRGLGACTWVVDPASRLVGVGCVGELWIEGPLVGGGYLNDPAKTAASFIEDPPWLLKGGGTGQPGRRGRLYKTGDLVRYKSDGSLVFVRRKDMQVKLRGQRVELAEVEHHIRECLADKGDGENDGVFIAAEVTKPKDGDRDILIALISPVKADSMSQKQLFNAVAELMNGVNSRLATIVPSYMIPSGYMPWAKFPRTATGKLDRRSLKAELCALRLIELRKRLVTTSYKRPVETASEAMLQRLWASVLGIDAESISANDNFFELGGDSIHAMRLSTAASHKGMPFNVRDIMTHPQLDQLALCLHSSLEPAVTQPAPMSLLGLGDVAGLVKEILMKVSLTDFEAHDILPVSHSQRSFLDGAINGTPIGINHFFLDLPPSTDVPRLSVACEKLIQHFEVLRSVFVAFCSRFYQIVLRSLSIPLEIQDCTGDLSDYFETFRREDGSQAAELGRPFLRLVLLRSQLGNLRLVIRISHAQYDGLSFGKILSSLAKLYDGHELPPEPSLSSLIHLQSKDLDYSYWDHLLTNSSMSYFNPQSPPDSDGRATFSILRLERTISSPTASANLTKATIFTSACAMMLQSITDSDDVLFGRVVSGRAALPLELHNIVFPCITVLPVRVHIPTNNVPASVSAQIREQYITGLQYESVGLPQLSRKCQSWPKGAVEFGCVTQYQNVDENPVMDISGAAVPTQHYRAEVDEQGKSDTVQIIALPAGSELKLIITAKSLVCDMDLLETAMEALCCAIASFGNTEVI